MDTVRAELEAAEPASLAELQRVLREPAAVLAGGRGGIEGVLERLWRARPETVCVIVSSHEPCVVDSRDSVVRRLGGAAAAGRIVSVLRKPWFTVLAFLSTLLSAIGFQLAYLGWLHPALALAIVLVYTAILGLPASVMLSLPILARLVRRFELYFITGHVIVVAVGGLVLMENRMTGWVWLLHHLVLLPLVLANDAIASRPRALIGYILGLALMLAEIAGLVLRAFPVVPADIVVLQEVLPVRDRVQASLFCCSLYIARFVATMYNSSGNFVLLKGLRIAKYSKVAGETIIARLSVSRRVAAATAAQAEVDGAAQVDAQADAHTGAHTGAHAGVEAACGAEGTQVTQVTQPGAAHGMSEETYGALCAAARAALGATTGNDTAARELLLRVLRELIGEREHRKATMVVKEELISHWQARRNAAETEMVHIVLPSFVPLMVDPNRTIAAVLGGHHFNRTVYAVCRSRPFKAGAALITPFVYTIGVVGLCQPGNTLLLLCWAPLAVIIVAIYTWQSLLLNTVVLREIVFTSWDFFFCLGNMYVVAATGAVVFIDPVKGAAYLVFQLSATFYFLNDAAPPSRAARRLTGWLVGLYAVNQLLGIFLFLQHVYPIQDFELRFLGVSINLKYTCIGCQLNSAILSLRFAWRALTDQSNLVFLNGLCRVTMLLRDATELRAHVIAVNELGARTIERGGTMSRHFRWSSHHTVAPVLARYRPGDNSNTPVVAG